ncbi:MAG: SusD/RagB family nutrient-binding outer membrane lipoprotein [Chitinophagaceae bacterium]|nr:SusD/RagB family nutrient-binding outer membrane lipoprotein [Chitinophagaceae bacterium]
MKKYLSLIFLIVMVAMMSGCKKYLDVNRNPNASTDPPIEGLLANVTNLTPYNNYYLADLTSYYTQYLASPSISGTADTYQQSDPTTAWGSIYNTLTDLYDMNKFAGEKGMIAYQGVSYILTAYNLSIASNVWGDLPYSEAFVGGDNLAPKYDKQEGIYDTCLALIDRGIALLNSPNAANQLNSASDYIHGGSVGAWVKTAYSLKARLLNQVSKLSSYSATSVLSAIDKAYTSNDDDAQITAFEVRNPWAQNAISNANLVLDVWLSSYFVNATNDSIYGVFDPRLPQITNPTDSGVYAGTFYPAGQYRGTPNGAGFQGKRNTDHVQCYIDVNKWYSSTNSPLLMLTNSEVRFIEAEAALRSGQTTRAYNAYLAGIQASMEKLGVAPADIQTYITDPVVAVGASNLTLQLIMKEKYVACFLQPVTWVDMRRFDYNYQGFTMPVNASLSTFIRRADYPSTETSRNGANVPPYERTDHLWWDK